MRIYKSLIYTMLMAVTIGCAGTLKELDTVNKQAAATEITWGEIMTKVDVYLPIMSAQQLDTYADAIKKFSDARDTFKLAKNITDAKSQIELMDKALSTMRDKLLAELILQQQKKETSQ